MARWLTALLMLSLGACVSQQQRLSAAIYDHEQLAHVLDERGDHESAAAQRAAAQRDRERLIHSQASFTGARETYF